LKKVILASKKDFVIEWFSNGHGGSNVNAHKNLCRIKHPESGAQAQGTTHRESSKNQKDAFDALTKTMAFQKWLRLKLDELRTGETLEERVEKQLSPRNLRVEALQDGQWVEVV